LPIERILPDFFRAGYGGVLTFFLPGSTIIIIIGSAVQRLVQVAELFQVFIKKVRGKKGI